jgi:CRP-like cAMP-binding protein
VTTINFFKHSPDAIEVESGHTVFREGEAGDTMFVVLEGAVEVSHDGRVIETIGAGQIMGELALIDTGPRSASGSRSCP